MNTYVKPIMGLSTRSKGQALASQAEALRAV